jgi:hypothetical protein
MKRALILSFTLILTLSCSGESPTEPQGQFFTVEVAGERFRMLVTDPETIRLARENYEGRNQRFPIGNIQRGSGGFNEPWSWSYIPDSIRMVEVAIEVCDGRPSYVNDHLDDYLRVGYCPWGARVVSLGR